MPEVRLLRPSALHRATDPASPVHRTRLHRSTTREDDDLGAGIHPHKIPTEPPLPLPTDYAAFLGEFHSAKFEKLLPAQAYVLEKYAASFAQESDLAIQLPTGAGKTLIALLIAEAWRREGRSAAILSANKTLARQMEKEAKLLGMPAVLMEGSGQDIPAAHKRAFHRHAAVAVMNYWVYFNQKPAIDPADLIIMDDAHLAEHCLHSLYSVEINRFKHQELFATIATELASRFPEYPALVDAAASGKSDDASGMSSDTSAELLSFISQADILSRLVEIIESSPSLQNDTDLKFRWRRLRNHVGDFNFYVSGTAIWLRPYVYPLSTTQYYSQAQQVIYLSATIGDPSDLRRRLGGRAIKSMPVPKEHSEVTSGRRLIVMNRLADKEDIPKRMQILLLAALTKHPKSLWLCSSEAEATRARTAVSEWLNKNGLVHPSWVLTPLGDEIDKFKSSAIGHLFVAGRFDGMDFKGDECRLVVLLTLPKAINLQEEFITSYLRDSDFMRRRLNQRIVQALGRCNRAKDDYALYLLADQRFPTHFGHDANLVGLPSNIVGELDMAQDLADAEEAELVELVTNFMSGQFSKFDSLAKNYEGPTLASKPLQTAPDTSEDETLGWNALYPSQNYGLAADHFERCWDKMRPIVNTEIGALHGWQWAKSLYSQHLQGDRAARTKFIQVLQDALGKGQKSSWFNRQRAALNRYLADAVAASEALQEEYPNAIIRAFDELLEKVGVKGEKFQKYCEKISSNLVSDDHSLFQDGLEALGRLLGFTATRPKYSAATDCRWRGSFGAAKEAYTFEAKIENKETSALSATDIGQAHIQLARAATELSNMGFAVHGTLVTHLKSFHSGAQGSLGAIRVIEKQAVFELWKVVQGILVKYRAHWSLEDIPARLAAAEGIRSRLPRAGWLARALELSETFVGSAVLLSEWKTADSGSASPHS
ncbi:DEAD/DEAH box helicase family protein [Archangium sp. Cb G35]|uniref:DEAD/DEAH box helicase family protein n=1 Tax=Archangium sp. Cb G35 TaxID=1920190 RepID=UPI00116130AD|nr:DEAD/DEAH box helicase family protein [Archangium sp. Cb G35]